MLSAFRRLFSSLVRSVRRAFVRVLFYFIFISSKEQRVLVVGFVYMEKKKKTSFCFKSWHPLKLIKCSETQSGKKRAARGMSNASAKFFPALHLITSSAANLHFVSFRHEEGVSRNGVDFGPKQL